MQAQRQYNRSPREHGLHGNNVRIAQPIEGTSLAKQMGDKPLARETDLHGNNVRVVQPQREFVIS